MAGSIAKLSTWFIRFLQLCFAIIATGVFAWFVHETRDAGLPTLREEVVPLVFSVLAMVFTFFSIFTLLFLSRTMIYAAAFLDLVIFAGYLASAGVYKDNFHVHWWENPLYGYIVYGRELQGESPHGDLTSALVKLGAALIIMQIILFFFTMLLSFWVAKETHDVAHGTGTGNEATYVGNEKRGLFGRRRAGPATTNTSAV